MFQIPCNIIFHGNVNEIYSMERVGGSLWNWRILLLAMGNLQAKGIKFMLNGISVIVVKIDL